MGDALRRRVSLPHVPPPGIPEGGVFFLTICGRPDGVNQFCVKETGGAVLEAARAYHHHGRWYCPLLLLMPDHLHALIAFPPGSVMTRTVARWKAYLARTQKIHWQRDFFDHRLRDDESEAEKEDYILHNPVRAGLVARPEDWPYVWRLA